MEPEEGQVILELEFKVIPCETYIPNLQIVFRVLYQDTRIFPRGHFEYSPDPSMGSVKSRNYPWLYRNGNVCLWGKEEDYDEEPAVLYQHELPSQDTEEFLSKVMCLLSSLGRVRGELKIPGTSQIQIWSRVQ